MSTTSVLKNIDDDEVSRTPFGEYEEEAIISLAFDVPDFFTSVGRFMNPSMFARLECQIIISMILNLFEEFDVVPTRRIVRDRILGI